MTTRTQLRRLEQAEEAAKTQLRFSPDCLSFPDVVRSPFLPLRYGGRLSTPLRAEPSIKAPARAQRRETGPSRHVPPSEPGL
jgi:hypothetical protein